MKTYPAKVRVLENKYQIHKNVLEVIFRAPIDARIPRGEITSVLTLESEYTQEEVEILLKAMGVRTERPDA